MLPITASARRSVFMLLASAGSGHAARKLPLPVLALGGASASKDGPLLTMRAVATDVRGGVVERAGHYLAEERPEVFAREVLTFLAGASDR
jgi:pimeloyl-ACP methyl ester carboxylesterase